MKTKFLLVAMVGLLTFTTIPAAARKGGTEIRVTAKASAAEVKRAHELQERIHQIEALDPDQLSREERTALKKEMKAIKKEARQMDNVYVYFGGGFLLLLILLIILI